MQKSKKYTKVVFIRDCFLKTVGGRNIMVDAGVDGYIYDDEGKEVMIVGGVVLVDVDEEFYTLHKKQPAA